ncbi:MAG: beta-xylosidase [Candidatus Adlerbacteria bacterium]|nr:beta-xylosidase [Candidatus Adlerbacteria bacterium]
MLTFFLLVTAVYVLLTEQQVPAVSVEDSTIATENFFSTVMADSPQVFKEVASTTAAHTSVPNYYGVAAGQTLSGLSVADLAAEFDDLAALGVGWVRFDIDWSEVQPTDREHFNWRNIDRIVIAAEARNIRLVATLGYAPRWAWPEGCFSSKCAPNEPSDFARFVKTAVARYAPKGVHYWEIWNEPNLAKFWQPRPSIGYYVILLKESFKAIKATDPGAVVISGGLGPTATDDRNIAPLDFVEGLYEDGGGEYFDALGFHPYSFPVPPSYTRVWNAWSQMYATNPSLRSIMIAHGDANKKIWMTEFGAPTGGPGNLAGLTNYTRVEQPSFVSEELQAHMLDEAFTLAEEYEWAGPLFWYSYKDLGTSLDTVENFFGLLRFDGSKKPAYTALEELHTAR